MPKLEIPESQLTSAFEQVRFPDRKSMTSFALEHGINFLGSGKYCIVTNGDTPGTVDAINYIPFPRLTGLSLLYSQQIWHLMFPNNFPAFHAVYWENLPDQKQHRFNGTCRQQVIGKQLQTQEEVVKLFSPSHHQRKKLSQGALPKNVPLWWVEETLKTIDQYLWLDRNPNNFFVTPSEQQIYVDTLPIHQKTVHKVTLFTDIINRYKMGEDVKQKVLAKLSRLQQLFPLN